MSEAHVAFAQLDRQWPTSLEELAELVRQAARSRIPIYPVGGATSLDYGGRPARPGRAVHLGQLRRVLDYPARDLTITVQAGLPVAELQALLAQEHQHWAVDVPQPNQATVGGVVACNVSGPRRYAWGAISESVLAVRAVDGQGMLFSAGARVVKNAAGYNLCRALAGSLGTLAVLGEITLRVQPLPESTVFGVAQLEDWDLADRWVGWLMEGRLLPTGIQLAAGPAWTEEGLLGVLQPPAKAWLLVGLAGSAKEVAWQMEQLQSAWQQAGIRHGAIQKEGSAQAVWRRLVEFPLGPAWADRLANGLPPGPRQPAPLQSERFLVIQAGLLPSRVVRLMARWRKMDPAVSVLAHAAQGTLVGYFPLQTMEASRWVRELVFPSVLAEDGHAQVLAAPADVVLTPTELWTHPPARHPLMQAIKQRFDPLGILNPGRLGFTIQ